MRLHLAPALKKLVTILLLMVLAGEVVVYLPGNGHTTVCVQETEEKAEKTGEEKKDKQFVGGLISTSAFTTGIGHVDPYNFPGFIVPLLDHLTPPPDSLV